MDNYNKDHGKQTLESMQQAQWYNCWVLNKFKKYLGGKILEIGCGIGNFTSTIINYGKVYAIDIHQEYITELVKKSNNEALIGLGDIEKGEYFFDNILFDSIICLNVLEHIENDQKALENIYKILATGGFLILIVPAHSFLYNSIDKSIGHFRRYDLKSLSEMLGEKGFSVVEGKYLNFFGAVGWWIAGRIFKDQTVSTGKIKLFNLLAPILLTIEDLVKPKIGTSILIIAQKTI